LQLRPHRERPIPTTIASRLVTCALTVALAATTPAAAHAAPRLDGAWVGTLELATVRLAPAPVAASLGQSASHVSGTVTLSGQLAAGTFTISGVTRRGGARLSGVRGAQILRWRAHWSRRRAAWRGRMRLRNGALVLRGRLTLTRGSGGPASGCGADFFAHELMPRLLEPVCGQCHVAGGAAAGTRLRITPGDPASTALSAAALVDGASPGQSLLLRKPRGDVPHTGGILAPAGSTEEQSLLQWISLITPPLCAAGPPGGGSGDVFTDNCASCHGADAGGTPTAPNIRCATRVADAIRVGRGTAMPSFPALSDAEVAALQARLDDVCTASGRPGADLWAGNCGTCHGSDARGGQNGLGVRGPNVRCNRGIAEPVRSGADDMPPFPGLSAPDIDAVQQFLLGLCPPGSASGEDLFAGNCASCHGSDAGGGADAPSVRCATRVANAVQLGRGAAMPSFPAFVGADVTALTARLDELCTASGRTGSDLYAGNCSGCHGGAAQGGQNGLGVRGPSIRCTGAGDYVEKVREGDDQMPAFPRLDGSDVDAIVGFVHGTYCSGG
jgi:mono/diheme cytochrome c family protein